MLIGYYYHALGFRSEKCGMWGLSLLIGSSFCFLAMLFIAGSLQVPRRYSDYNAIPWKQFVASAKIQPLSGPFSQG